MNMVRMNITIPEEMAQQLDKLAGAKKKSHFIVESLRERMKKIEHEELQKNLEEGYKAERGESLSLAREFEQVDIEGWDEY